MSKRKGLSVDEKRDRMLKFIIDSKSLWTVQELEKELPKKCGIVSQSVKDVLLSLEADGLVSNDKVGVKQLYWAFASDNLVKMESKLSQTTKENDAKRRKISSLTEEKENLLKDRGESEERTENLEKIKALEEERRALKAQLDEFQVFDPEAMQKKEKMVFQANDSTNRWTDNIFSIRSYCSRKFNIEGSQIDKQFHIPSDMDYVEKPVV